MHIFYQIKGMENTLFVNDWTYNKSIYCLLCMHANSLKWRRTKIVIIRWINFAGKRIFINEGRKDWFDCFELSFLDFPPSEWAGSSRLKHANNTILEIISNSWLCQDSWLESVRSYQWPSKYKWTFYWLFFCYVRHVPISIESFLEKKTGKQTGANRIQYGFPLTCGFCATVKQSDESIFIENYNHLFNLTWMEYSSLVSWFDPRVNGFKSEEKNWKKSTIEMKSMLRHKIFASLLVLVLESHINGTTYVRLPFISRIFFCLATSCTYMRKTRSFLFCCYF